MAKSKVKGKAAAATKQAAATPKARPKAAAKPRAAAAGSKAQPGAAIDEPIASQPFLEAQRTEPAARPRFKDPSPLGAKELAGNLASIGARPTVDLERLTAAANRIKRDAAVPLVKLPDEIRASMAALSPRARSFHGAKFSLAYFPGARLRSPCADKFGYMSPAATRATSQLPFNPTVIGLLDKLGALMADPGRETTPDSPIPAGFTYVGQFVDHDITLDVSSSLDVPTDANTIHNMRTPSLDLDSVYGRGPALDPFLYVFPSAGNPSAIKLQLGVNSPRGPGGPAGSSGNPGAMQQQTDFDVPRMPTAANTAIIGDPRNDENLIVVQFHHAMLRFHNAVVDLLVARGFTGDVFVEAKRIVTHHYQWAVVHDFLERVCGRPAVSAALSGVVAPVGSAFRMPVEFAVAAYRFGHSMIRDRYWVNFNFPGATLEQVFQFNRNPNLPVLSNWVVDMNALFETGVPVPIFNFARKIDSVLANELERLPGFAGLMAILAARNLRRGLALGLPSGQGMAKLFGVAALSEAQLVGGLPSDEVAVLRAHGKLLLARTPLWYYVLREAMVQHGGDRLGRVGARIVAETFARILKRDADSYLNVPGAGFAPFLPSAGGPGSFTFADLVIFAGVTQP